MTPPFRPCLLSGGASRRMGCDKALLPHPAGGTWLVHSLELLVTLGQPVTLLSRHHRHLELARALAVGMGAGAASLTALEEPPPWQGPLRALARLMECYPNERLLLCPVDMPWLDGASLRALLTAAREPGGSPEPSAEAPILLAHDGERLQPLLGLYPAGGRRRLRLASHLARGERRLQSWLAGETWRAVPLAPGPLRNVNRPEDLGPSLAHSPATGP